MACIITYPTAHGFMSGRKVSELRVFAMETSIMLKILISDKLGEAGLERLDAYDDVEYDMLTSLSKRELMEILPQYDALIVRSGTQVDAEVLGAGNRLRVVGRAGMGVDNIDVRSATERGIIVMNTPDANSIATAEQTMALMLAVSRHTANAHQSLKSGEWLRSRYVGVELYGKTLGIVGFGKIGRLVARRAQAFGMQVIAYDPFVSEEVGRTFDVALVDMEDLLPQSDYISLHAALVPATEGIINEQAISQMKDGVILVNVARGRLVDEAALVAGIEGGKIGAAAVDVYSSEPPLGGNPLLGHAKVLHTPHLGASSIEAQRAVATQIADQVVNALHGTDYRNSINMPFPAGPDFGTISPYMELAEKLGKLHAKLAEGAIQRVEIEVHGDEVTGLVRAIASAMLKGALAPSHEGPINYVNAPAIAAEREIVISQTRSTSPIDYPNLISSKVSWQGGSNLMAGTLFGGREPRIVQLNRFTLDARPEGIVLLTQNEDIPGTIGQIGTLLAEDGVNIGEWRTGRGSPGEPAVSFISLDNMPSAAVMAAINDVDAVVQAKLLEL
jgi:D-3-phosphoglycerate dehydrogenase